MFSASHTLEYSYSCLLYTSITLPSCACNLEQCLGQLATGFSRIREQLTEAPVAISFAFPGPADYPAGIIGNLPNFPSFRGGVALGPYLEEKFGIPVFINNDEMCIRDRASLVPYQGERPAGSRTRNDHCIGQRR